MAKEAPLNRQHPPDENPYGSPTQAEAESKPRRRWRRRSGTPYVWLFWVMLAVVAVTILVTDIICTARPWR